MGVQVYRQANKFLKRCEKCHKLSHYIYRMQLGPYYYNFCSGFCAEAARKEYEAKEKQGITPNNLQPIGGDEEDHGE